MTLLQKLLQAQCECLPPLGSDLEDLAQHYAISTERLLANLLYMRDLPLIPLTVSPGNKSNFKWLGGHCLAPRCDDDYGPRRKYRAMFVFKSATKFDIAARHYMSSKSSMEYKQLLHAGGLVDASEIYVTGLLKTMMLKQSANLPQKWIAQQSILLLLEILLVQPSIIVAFGREPCQFFVPKYVGGKVKFTMASGECRWQPLSFLTSNVEEYPDVVRANMLASASPGIIDVEEVPESRRRLLASAQVFLEEFRKEPLPVGQTRAIVVNEKPKYEVIHTVEELVQLFPRMIEQSRRSLIAVDAEWQGRHPQNRGSFIRCLQFGWDRGKAAVVKLTDTEGRPTWSLDGYSNESATRIGFQIVEQFFKRYKLRPAGFYFQSDNEWLSYFGLDLMQFFTTPDKPEACRDEGGFALDLAVLAYDELMSNELEMIRRFFTKVHDYYSPFEAYRKSSGVSDDEFKAGFGWIPDDILFPYAGGDADTHISASLEFCERLLDADAFGNSLWLPYWNSLKATPVAAEIMRSGMPFNKQRAFELALIYKEEVDKRVKRLENAFAWSDFPIDTWQCLNIAMYGAKFSGYVGQDGTRQDRRPVGAKSLNLQPVIDNAKRPTPWSRIVALGKEATTHPSSGLKAIGMMVNSDTVEQRIQLENGTELIEQVKPPEELKLLADTKILRQVQKNFLGYIDTKTNKDKWTWTKGYPALIDDDGYLRCFISTTKETARWSAARPNLHNSPNKAEGLYAKILKTNYPGFIRTMFETPPGHVIIETDLASAELFMLAMAGNDDVLWDHCSRNLLDEDDPNFVDPHSRLCVSAFDLKCAPTKSGLKSLELEHLRNVGKCLAEDEIIWTDRGLFPVSLLVQQADTVIDLETRLSSIRGYTPCQVVQRTGVKSCTRIVDDIGGELIVSDEHKSFVLAVDGSLGLREARNTVVGDQIFVRTTPTSGNADYELPAQTRGKIAIAFLLESVLAGSQLNVNGCFVFALFMSSAVKRSNDEYVINVANSCGPKPASPELKEKFAASILQVAALLESVVGLRFNVTVDGRDGTISVKGPNAVEVFDMCFKHWQLLPSIVLMMSRGCRLSYLSGLFIGKIRGVRQGICALVPTSIERKVRLLAQSCGILLKPAGDSKDTTVLVGVREHDRRMLESLRFYINRSQLQELLSTSSEFDLHYERILSRLTDQTVRGERSGIAAKLGYTYTCNVSDSGEDLVKMIRELKQFISSRTVDIAEDDLEFIMFSEQILSGRYRASWVTRVEAAGQRKTIDVQTDDTQYHAIVCGNGVLTHNSVIYGWAYGRQAEAIVMGAKELGQKVSLEDAKRLLEYLPQQYAGAGRYLEEAASRVDVGYLVMPMGRIRRAPITSDKKQRSAYMREFMNAPIQGGVADIINNVAKNISDLRKQLAMRFIIALQMHDAFYFIVPYDEIMRLCVDIIPEAIVNRVPIVPFSLSGVRSNAPPRRMGFNISIMRRWKEKMTKAERVAWLESIGIDAYAIPRLELD